MLDSHTSTLGLSGSPFLTLAIEERRHIGVRFHTSLLGTAPHTVADGTVLAAIVLETWRFTFRTLSYWSDISCNMINTLRVRNEKLIFLFLISNIICCWCSKDPSQ